MGGPPWPPPNGTLANMVRGRPRRAAHTRWYPRGYFFHLHGRPAADIVSPVRYLSTRCPELLVLRGDVIKRCGRLSWENASISFTAPTHTSPNKYWNQSATKRLVE